MMDEMDPDDPDRDRLMMLLQKNQQWTEQQLEEVLEETTETPASISTTPYSAANSEHDEVQARRDRLRQARAWARGDAGTRSIAEDLEDVPLLQMQPDAKQRAARRIACLRQDMVAMQN